MINVIIGVYSYVNNIEKRRTRSFSSAFLRPDIWYKMINDFFFNFNFFLQQLPRLSLSPSLSLSLSLLHKSYDDGR